MRKQKIQIEPINPLSPQDNLCQISMQIDHTEINDQNYKTPYIGTNKSYRFDGWVKLQTKGDQKFKVYRSNIALNKPIKHEDVINRSILSRYAHQRNISNQQNLINSKRSKDDIQFLRARSFDLNDSQHIPDQQSTQMYHSSFFQQSINNLRKSLISSRQAIRFTKHMNTKKQIESVNYPILQLGVVDPEKRYMFHIGKVRRLINNKNRKK